MSSELYHNEVILAGIVGDDLKFGKAKTGLNYCTFSMIIGESGNYIDDNDVSYKELVRIFVFNSRGRRIADQMKEEGLRRGMRVSVNGFLISTRSEYRGISLIQLAVKVKEIHIIKKQNN